jgi:hypothetical protein
LKRTQKATSLAGRTTVVAYWRILRGFCLARADGRLGWLKYSTHSIELPAIRVSATAVSFSVVTRVWKLNFSRTRDWMLGAPS